MKIKFLFYFIFHTSFSGFLFSQIIYTDSTIKHIRSVEFLGDFHIASNAISNNFIKEFYNGSFLSEELKLDVSDKLTSKNRLGAVLKSGLTYSSQFLDGKNKPTISFSFFDRHYLNMSFSDDLFDLIFFGNKIFTGDTARIGNFRFSYLHYEQLRFGWAWDGDFSHGSYGFAFSLLSGDQNQYIDGNSLGLYTASNGSYLAFPLTMKVRQTDTSQTKYFSQNGIGMSVDLFYDMPYVVWNKPGRITFAVTDLGFIGWNNNTLHYDVDSSYYFSGIDVADLIHLDTNAIAPSNTENIINNNSDIFKKKYSTYIPCTIDIHTRSYFGKQVSFEKGISWMLNTSAKPYYYAKLHFFLGRKKAFDLSYVFGYGGYGRFNSGVEVKKEFAKSYSVHIVDNYLFSGIANESYGMGLSIMLRKKF